MSHKMDRQGVRTPADIERKYPLGKILKAEGSSAKQNEQLNQLNQAFLQYVANTNARIKELEDSNASIKDIETTQTWFYSGVPTLENAPAVGWTDEQKVKHIGDLYYNEEDGSLYLFKCTDGIYSWVKCSSSAAETSNTYNVTFYSEDEVVIASYIIKQGDAVNPPVNEVTWVDNEGVAVTFPYTPTNDTNLYIQESTL